MIIFAPLAIFMDKNQISSQVGNFYAIGLNYKKADAQTRGRFSLDEAGQANLLSKAKQQGMPSLVFGRVRKVI
jgi:glutamyl-tRNA reductase